MATITVSAPIFRKPHQLKPLITTHFLKNIKPFSTTKFPTKKRLNHFTISAKTQTGIFDSVHNDEKSVEILHMFDEKQPENNRPIKFVLMVLAWASVSLVFSAFIGGDNNNAHAVASAAAAAADSIRASSFGLKVADFLRGSGWPDEAVVVALATLPVVELRGAIPVGYWLQLKPWVLTLLAVLGNMVPIPFIILYLKRFASFLARSSPPASRFLELLFKKAKQKAGPIEEFQWLGLMLFVAVPFPGTGAWTGAIIASILDMPFWPAISANFFGVVLAGLLVNLLVNLGLKYAIVTGVILFIISTLMWSVLRNIKKSLSSSS